MAEHGGHVNTVVSANQSKHWDSEKLLGDLGRGSEDLSEKEKIAET